VARQLGLATGSIGLTRSRCLRRLEEALLQLGWDGGEAGRQPGGHAANDAVCRQCSAAQILNMARRSTAQDAAGSRRPRASGTGHDELGPSRSTLELR
jgi:hypothetical protein